MSAKDPTRAAREEVARHLLPGERIETALPAVFSDLPRRTQLVRHLELFLGVLLAHPRAVVLTSRRLLVLPLRPRPGATDWYVVQLDTRGVRALGLQVRGRLVVVPLHTGVGARRLLVRAGDAERGRVLARLLGAPL